MSARVSPNIREATRTVAAGRLTRKDRHSGPVACHHFGDDELIPGPAPDVVEPVGLQHRAE
jgi:hypothetical protein